MDRLSSCYFCGTALDDSLAAYAIGTEDEGAEVVLCETCRRKLKPILEAAGSSPRTATGQEPSDGQETSEQAEPDETPEGAAAEPAPESADQPSDETAETTISALEYNKVMRLLQNREFPVDRTEFEQVAANAYGVARSDCTEVIDLAIDRGLLAEDDDQLVKPD